MCSRNGDDGMVAAQSARPYSTSILISTTADWFEKSDNDGITQTQADERGATNLTQRLESQIGGGIAVLVVLAVIFTVLSNLGAIDKAPIDGMSVGASKYSEPIQTAICDEDGANGPASNVRRAAPGSRATYGPWAESKAYRRRYGVRIVCGAYRDDPSHSGIDMPGITDTTEVTAESLADPKHLDLRTAVASFATPKRFASAWQLATSLGLFLLACAAMHWAYAQSYLLTLPLCVPAGGLLVRLFVIQHDCGHGAFFRSARANDLVGRVCSVFTCTPYASWRRQHAQHHGAWNNLDRRQTGADIYSSCLTVREYLALSRWHRRLHRIDATP